MNFRIKRSKAKKHDKIRYKLLCCFTRYYRLGLGEAPQEVKEMHARYSEGGHMTAGLFQKFMAEIQGESEITEQDVDKIMETLKELGPLRVFNRQHIPLDAFLRFLLSDDLNPAINDKIHHDMTAPLSHYFIFTGHNSYLTGNQWNSDCSDEPIIKALRRGVRAIELDVWPNSNKDDINVLHGRTMTTPVKFIKCLESIKEHAFVASEYPVIITLEDHLTPELQAKAAKIIIETFGEILYYPNSEEFKGFPSPDALKHHVIISTKPPKEYLERKPSKDFKIGDKEAKVPEEEPWGPEIQMFEEMENDEKSEHATEEDSDEEKAEAPEYKRLITIHAGKLKGSTPKDLVRVDSDYAKRISLSEPKLEKLAKLHPEHTIRFSQKHLLRIYPKGTRINSTNYNPLVAWTHGAQMVAFNMQGYGRNLWLAHGFFRANGGCGYVKKPNFLLKSANDNGNDENIFNPKKKRPVKKTLRVKLYMGDGWAQDFKKTHFDTFSPPDFYTKIGIAGVEADTIKKKTRTIEDSWTPCWDEVFDFHLTVPEMALLRIEVLEEDISDKKDFGGQTCLPVAELKSGIRAVPLHDKKGEKYKSVRLLMRFDFIPSSV